MYIYLSLQILLATECTNRLSSHFQSPNTSQVRQPQVRSLEHSKVIWRFLKSLIMVFQQFKSLKATLNVLVKFFSQRWSMGEGEGMDLQGILSNGTTASYVHSL